MTMLRVNDGPCAPLELSSMLSSPATGITNISVTRGAPVTRSTSTSTSTSTFLSRVTAPANGFSPLVQTSRRLFDGDLAGFYYRFPTCDFDLEKIRKLGAGRRNDIEAQVGKLLFDIRSIGYSFESVSYTHLRAHETRHDLVCR